uniref:Matrix-remodeling-associated protein 7 helical domain-containing protein n=1 Tax=Taeniopygia guttata TaxID=59729 RepID=H0ZBV4_TAEGU
MAPCSHPRGWGCHGEQLLSSKPWLQGRALEISGVPHSSSNSCLGTGHRHGARWAVGHLQHFSTSAEAARAGWLSSGEGSGVFVLKAFALFQIPPLGASPGPSLGHTGQAEDTSGHEALPSHAEEEEVDSENEKLVVREPEDEDAADEKFSFKYSPGKLRGNQYKSMMSKEELEEEQRVQREQLAAIFRLMKEKSDTFGEMSEGDMKEQLRLYDI